MSLMLSLPTIVQAKKRNDEHRARPQYGGTLVWGTTNEPTLINPILTSHSVSAALLDLIFDSLVRIDHNGRIIPGLADTWSISEDGLVYTFYLHKGVRFHDGIELTADDVKFTYEKISDPAIDSPWKVNTELIASWEIIDRYTIKAILNQPFPNILHKLIREIVPHHILQGQDLNKTPFNYHPTGTGPFQIQNFNRTTNRIELKVNPDYFGGRPYLDNILIKSYSDNTALWTALMRGEVDFVKFINREDYLILKEDPAFNTYEIPWKMYCALVYNPKDYLLYDPDIRKAIAYGINVDELIKAVSPGGLKSVGPFHPDSPGFNSEVHPIEYNPVKAKLTFMHHGWKDADGNGILEKGGKELELKILIDSRSQYYKKMAMIIRQQLSEIGIKVKILPYDDENMLTARYLDEHNPQAWLRFYQGLGNDLSEAVGSWYSSSSEFGKLWRYKNDEVDQLFEMGRGPKNLDKQKKIYRRIHRIIYDDQPACFLFYPMSFHALSSKYHNTEDFFCRYMPGYTMKEWFVTQ